jgi:hypothetical protein
MKVHGMCSLLVAALVAAACACQARAELVTVDDFSDLVLWAGTGENEAGFVLQFAASQTPTAVAWGYRWSGTATMQDMMAAIAGGMTVAGGSSPPPGLDARLSIAAQYFSFGDSGGVFINAIAYEQVGLAAPWTQATREIVNDYFQTGTYPSLYFKADAGGTWTNAGGGQTMPLGAAAVGISDLALTTGGWYGFVQSDGADPFNFTQPVAAVPEPGTWTLALGAAAAAAAARAGRRRR